MLLATTMARRGATNVNLASFYSKMSKIHKHASHQNASLKNVKIALSQGLCNVTNAVRVSFLAQRFQNVKARLV